MTSVSSLLAGFPQENPGCVDTAVRGGLFGASISVCSGREGTPRKAGLPPALLEQRENLRYTRTIMISLVAFLGNYGREYERTRHNVAWQFADSLPFADTLNWQRKFKGLYAAADDLGPERVYFLKPETYMNLSGESVGELARFFKITPERILLVHDELELPPGTVSLKWSGGLGGHNGLRSAKAVLGTADFWRFRFGIGRPDHADVAGYVLSEFTADERIILSQIFPQSAAMLAQALKAEPQKLLPEWNKKKLMA